MHLRVLRVSVVNKVPEFFASLVSGNSSRISFIRLIVIVVVITSPLLAQDSGLPREKIEALEKAITTEMSRQSIPGPATLHGPITKTARA